jgi:hypothetical protein
MIKPVIHENGTPAAALFAQYLTAHAAVQRAIDALGTISPIDRDYSLAEPDAHQLAKNEHLAHLMGLIETEQYLMAMVDHCHNYIKHEAIR